VNRRGLSLLEILISFVILLLVTLYLMSMFASGHRHSRRAQQFSIASFLVNQKMQDLLVTPVDDLSGMPGVYPEPPSTFAEPWDEYVYEVHVIPDDPPLYALDVEVRSPIGSIARARCITSAELSMSGIAVDPYANFLAFMDQTELKIISDGSPPALITTSAPGTGRLGGMLAGSPGFNLLYQAGQSQGLISYHEALPSPNTWGGPLPALPASLAPFRYTGVAIDRYDNLAVVGDANNRCLWVYQGDAAAPWTGLKPANPGLGSPAGIAMDPYASLVWVADNENQCLRKFMRSPVPPKYAAKEIEADPSGLGWWSTTRFRPPAPQTMGSPRGMAMDPSGWAVYVLDGARLWTFVEDDSSWTSVDLPADVIARIPSGLALDAHDSVFYVSCVLGQVARYDRKSGTWDGKFWPP